MSRVVVEVAVPVRTSPDALRAFLGSDRMRRLTGARPAGPGVAVVQGGWWYRGEWTARRDGDRTVLVHRVLNVAERGAWAVPLANRCFVGFRERCRAGVAELARRIEAELR